MAKNMTKVQLQRALLQMKRKRVWFLFTETGGFITADYVLERLYGREISHDEVCEIIG